MKIAVKLFILLSLVLSLASLPLQKGICECSQEGEPCGEGLGECCPTYTNDQSETRKLKCSSDPKTENTCVDDGAVKE